MGLKAGDRGGRKFRRGISDWDSAFGIQIGGVNSSVLRGRSELRAQPWSLGEPLTNERIEGIR